MQRRWHPSASDLTLTAGVMAFLLITFLLINGPVGAQTPGQGPRMSGIPDPGSDELAPRLLSGPKDKVLRLWRRSADLQAGGGGILLAIASPRHAWQTLLEILPKEKGVTALAPDLAVGPSGEMAVAYQWRQHLPRSKQIRLARSTDGGKTWTQSDTPLDRAGAAFAPKVGWGRERNLVVVWEDERRTARAWDIYARRSPDGGVTWEPEQVLSRFPRQNSADLNAKAEIISDGQNSFWVVWVGLRSGRSRLYLSRSTDGGQTWADPVELSGQSQSVFGQRLVRSGGRLLLVWEDTRTGRNRIYAVSSADGGATWTSPTRVDHLPEDLVTDAVGPVVAMSPAGEVFVAWHDNRYGRDDIFVGRSADGGRTWERADLRLDMDEPGTAVSRFPSLTMSTDGRIAVAWEDDRAGYEGIYLRVRGAGDRPTWGPEVLVAPPGPKTGARNSSMLWGRDGSLYVTWEVWDYTLGPQAVTKRIDGRTLVLDKK